MAGEIKFENVGYITLEQKTDFLWLHLHIFYRFGFTLTTISNYIHFKFIFLKSQENSQYIYQFI